MSTLLGYNLEPLDAFNIMEHVRKGKGLTEDEEKKMLSHDVPKWYIVCKECGIETPTARMEQVVRIWNRRVNDGQN